MHRSGLLSDNDNWLECQRRVSLDGEIDRILVSNAEDRGFKCPPLGDRFRNLWYLVGVWLYTQRNGYSALSAGYVNDSLDIVLASYPCSGPVRV